MVIFHDPHPSSPPHRPIALTVLLHIPQPVQRLLPLPLSSAGGFEKHDRTGRRPQTVQNAEGGPGQR